MRKNTLLLWLYSLVMLCSMSIYSCRKPDEMEPDPKQEPKPNPNPTEELIHADTLSNHLQFLSAVKVVGTMPSAASNNSIQISFKDTLYLTDQLPRPIKFLHKDPVQNVAGIFLQIGVSGSKATYYYDIPELENMKNSDSVSVIVIAIDPTNLEKPQTGEVTIVAYDQNKQPITQIVRPLKLDENRVDLPKGSGNGCGLTLPSGMVWDWELTIRADDLDKFWSEPNKVHSPQGQNIQGHCCNGNSLYPTNCPGDTTGNVGKKTLHFATYYKINFETFQFFENGTFFRQTMEDSPVPLPGQSDFCGNGEGRIQTSLKHTTYEGNWIISPSKVPPVKPVWWHSGDSLQLTLQGTQSSGTGYGNPGGVIHQLDCKIGALVLAQLSREGNGAHLIKFYSIRKSGELPWYQP